MTNLLKSTVASASIASQNTKSYIKLPTFKASDSSKVVVRKLNDYRAKIRSASSTLSHDEIINMMAYNKNLEFYEFSDITRVTGEHRIEEFLLDTLPRFSRGNNITTEKIKEVLSNSLVIKVKRKNSSKITYIAIIDDVDLKIKVSKELNSYYRLDYDKFFFGVVTVSTLESVASLQLDKIFEYPPYTLGCIRNEVMDNYEDAWFDDLNNVLSFDNGKKIATIRSDKKYQDEELNKTTFFNQLGFNKVEVDTAKYEGKEFDYQGFKAVEKDWQNVCNLLPHTVKPELKFRKLGKHKATGVYVPLLDIIAVDVRDTTSFIHEYGHHIDFTFFKGTEALSRKKEFKSILQNYKIKFRELISNGVGIECSQKKLDYFITPTEVFARAFELWFSHRYREFETSLCKKVFSTPDYTAFDDILGDVIEYFDNLYVENKSSDYTDYVIQEPSKDIKITQHYFKEVEPTNTGIQLSLF